MIGVRCQEKTIAGQTTIIHRLRAVTFSRCSPFAAHHPPLNSILNSAVVQNGLSGVVVSRYFSWLGRDRFEEVSDFSGWGWFGFDLGDAAK